jgi:group I intron endonuclease
MMRPCIYRITNLETGQNYIGSTSDYTVRRWHHRKSLRRGEHHSKKLQKAWDNYGEECFEFAVIKDVPVDRLFEWEQYYIDRMDASYNVLPVAGSSAGWSRKKGLLW